MDEVGGTWRIQSRVGHSICDELFLPRFAIIITACRGALLLRLVLTGTSNVDRTGVSKMIRPQCSKTERAHLLGFLHQRICWISKFKGWESHPNFDVFNLALCNLFSLRISFKTLKAGPEGASTIARETNMRDIKQGKYLIFCYW